MDPIQKALKDYEINVGITESILSQLTKQIPLMYQQNVQYEPVLNETPVDPNNVIYEGFNGGLFRVKYDPRKGAYIKKYLTRKERQKFGM